MQGVGLFTLEELRYSPEGFLYTRGPGMYKIPAFGDIPTELKVSLLRDSPNERAIFSSKVILIAFYCLLLCFGLSQRSTYEALLKTEPLIIVSYLSVFVALNATSLS